MKHILLITDRNNVEQFDYSVDYYTAMDRIGANSGNTVFQYCLQKILSCKDNCIVPYRNIFRKCDYSDKEIDNINNNYDCIVYSPANIISRFAKDTSLKGMRDLSSKIKIPIYLFGVGAQSDKEYSTDFMKDIRFDVNQTFENILNAGGKIATRGFFSGECLKLAGISEDDFTVTGCPSIFMLGPKIQIGKNRINYENFIPAINGYEAWNSRDFVATIERYSKAIFVCQDEFYKLMYLPKNITEREIQYLSDEDEIWFKMYNQDRIKLYCDFPAWYTDFRRRNISFSYGCRLHGNIVPILAGIPAYIVAIDSRVREMAEYFDLPFGYSNGTIPDLFSLYEKTDYSNFNNRFSSRYDIFTKFLCECGLSTAEVTVEEMDAPIVTPENRQIIIEHKEKNILYKKRAQHRIKGKVWVFVGTEFGYFDGHGFEAEYLYAQVKALLNFEGEIEVHVIASVIDEFAKIFDGVRCVKHSLKGKGDKVKAKEILEILKECKPDYVECIGSGGLCLESIYYKMHSGCELKTTRFTFFHTLGFAESLHNNHKREIEQINLVDENVVSSIFMKKFIKEKYGVESKIQRFPMTIAPCNKYDLCELIDYNSEFSMLSNRIVICCCAPINRFYKQKELIDIFIELSRQNNWKSTLLLVRKGNNQDNDEEYIATCKESVPHDFTEMVKFVNEGRLYERQMIAAITDVAVCISDYEDIPISLAEYVYYGVPVIASENSGLVEIMDETKEYTAFKTGDMDDFKKVLNNYIMSKPSIKKQVVYNQYQSLRYMTNPDRVLVNKIEKCINL